MTLDQLIQKLTSRKFLLALAAFLSTAFAGQLVVSALVAVLYVLAEAHVDGKAAAAPEPVTLEAIEVEPYRVIERFTAESPPIEYR